MKRTALVVVMVAALIVGVVAYASAATENVAVTAKVNPAFSMTINQNTVDFGTQDIGSTYTDNSTLITVKSNKLWDFSKSNTAMDAELVGRLSEGTDVAAGTGLAKGVTPITATYSLDLTGDGAYQLEPATAYNATWQYDAVQQ